MSPPGVNALSDTHCHLDFGAYNKDRGEVIERALNAGLTHILNPGIDLASSRKATAIAGEYAEIYAAVGVHPNDALTFDHDTISSLRSIAFPDGKRNPKVVAVGEIGLDYYRDRAPYDIQKQVLIEQLNLAAELNLPVVIHNRQASGDLLPILAQWRKELVASGSPLAEKPGVLHSFSDSLETAQAALEMGFYLGISGPVTFQNAKNLQEVVRDLPLSRLIIETDGPFLAPHPHRGKRNEPAYVALVAEKIAAIKSMSLSGVCETTTENAGSLLNW